MQASRAKQFYRLLDLKALTEYYVANDGYSANLVQGRAQDKVTYAVVKNAGKRAQFSRALFAMLQRVSLGRLASALGVQIGEGLYDITQYLSLFRWLFFKNFLSSNKDEICKNKFMDRALSDQEFKEFCDIIFSDKDFYCEYLANLSSALVEMTINLIVTGKSVLELYSRIPQLVCGLVSRAHRADKYKILSDVAMVTALEGGFSAYCGTLSFEEEQNENTIIEKYIGSAMHFYFLNWFKNVAPTLVKRKVLLQGNESKGTYTVDKLRVSSSTNHRSSDLYELYHRVIELDCDMFRMKKDVANNLVPYYSLTDFVIGLEYRSICDSLTKELKQLGNRSITFTLLDTLRTDVFIDKRDQSFRAKVTNYKSELMDIYRSAPLLNSENFKTGYLDIMKKYTDKAGVKADSNKSYIDYYNTVSIDEGERLLPDEQYAQFKSILSCVCDLKHLSFELRCKGSSLAFLWNSFVNEDDMYSADKYIGRTTVDSCLLGIRGGSVVSGDAFSDGYDANEIQLSTNRDTLKLLYMTFQQRQGKKSTDTIQLGNGRFNSPVADKPVDPRVWISSFSNVLLDTFKRGWEAEAVAETGDNLEAFAFCLRSLRLADLNLEGSSVSTEKYTAIPASGAVVDSETFCREFVRKVVVEAIEGKRIPEFTENVQRTAAVFRNILKVLFPRHIQYLADACVNCLGCTETISLEALANCIIRGFQEGRCLYVKNGQGPQSYINALYGIGRGIYDIVSSCLELSGNKECAVYFNDIQLVCDLFAAVVVLCCELQVTLVGSLGDISEGVERLRKMSRNNYTLQQKALLSELFKFSQISSGIDTRVLNSLYGTCVVEQARQLKAICKKYGYIRNTLINQIKVISNNLSETDEGFRISNFRSNLLSISANIVPVVNVRYLFYAEYNILFMSVMQGALKLFMSESELMQHTKCIEDIDRREHVIRMYIEDAAGLVDCYSLPHTAGNSITSVAYLSDVYLKAATSPEFERKKMVLANLGSEAQIRFRTFKDRMAVSAQTGYFLLPSGSYYSVRSADKKTRYYLHSCGIFVGCDEDTGEYKYMTFEEAYRASLLGDRYE